MNVLDRLACASFGVVSGAIYGTILAIAVGFFTTGDFRWLYVWCTAAVFGGLGFIVGPRLGDIIAGTVHLVYGLCAGILSGAAFTVIDPQPHDHGPGRTLFLFGLGTGVAFFFVWYFSR